MRNVSVVTHHDLESVLAFAKFNSCLGLATVEMEVIVGNRFVWVGWFLVNKQVKMS